MPYKRYFTIKGKKYGPYYYESYRDKNGKVRKKYVKREIIEKSNKMRFAVEDKYAKQIRDSEKEPMNNFNRTSNFRTIIFKDRKGVIRMKKIR